MSDGQAQDVRRTDTAGVADLLASLGEETTRLVRQEFALAKAETREELRGTRVGVLEIGAAAIMAQVALIVASFAAVEALENVMARGWALLVVAGVWLLLSVVLGYVGSRMLQRTDLIPQRTAETLRDLPHNLKGS